MPKKSLFIDDDVSTDDDDISTSSGREDVKLEIKPRSLKSFSEFASKYQDVNELEDLEDDEEPVLSVASQISLLPKNSDPSLWIVRVKRHKEVECMLRILKEVQASKVEMGFAADGSTIGASKVILDGGVVSDSATTNTENNLHGNQTAALESGDSDKPPGESASSRHNMLDDDLNQPRRKNVKDSPESMNQSQHFNRSAVLNSDPIGENDSSDAFGGSGKINKDSTQKNAPSASGKDTQDRDGLESLFDDIQEEKIVKPKPVKQHNPLQKITPTCEAILSVICKPDLIGYLYIESYSKMAVLNVIKNIKFISNRATAVPLNEMPDCLTIKDRFYQKYCKINKGKFKGKICEVLKKLSSEIVRVAIAPQNRDVMDNGSLKKVHLDGLSLVLEGKNLYWNGFLIKEIPIQHLGFDVSFEDTAPFFKRRFYVNDKVRILKGDLKNLLGRVVAVRSDYAEIQVDVPLPNVKNHPREVKKKHRDSDSDDISSRKRSKKDSESVGSELSSKKKSQKKSKRGSKKGSESESDDTTAKKRAKKKSRKVSESDSDDITVKKRSKKRSSSVSESDSDDITFKIPSKKKSNKVFGSDSDDDFISRHKDENSSEDSDASKDSTNSDSSIENDILNQSQTITLTSNSDIHRVPLQHLTKHYDPGTKVSYNNRNATLTSTNGNKAVIIFNDNFTETLEVNIDNLEPFIENKFEIIKNEPEKRYKHALNNKMCEIIRGKYKGCGGTVKDVFSREMRVVLDTSEVVMVNRDDVVCFDKDSAPLLQHTVDDSRTPGFFGTASYDGNTPSMDGGRTPAYGFGSKTPAYGGRTPGYREYGGKTPGYGYGSRTPGYGGKTPAYGTGGKTPGYLSGGKTPGYGYGGKTPGYGTAGKTPSHSFTLGRTPGYATHYKTPTNGSRTPAHFSKDEYGSFKNAPDNNIKPITMGGKTPKILFTGSKTPSHYKTDLYAGKSFKQNIPSYEAQQRVTESESKTNIHKFDNDQINSIIRPEKFDKAVVVDGEHAGKEGIVIEDYGHRMRIILENQGEIELETNVLTKKHVN